MDRQIGSLDGRQTMVHDISFDVAKEGTQLPRPKVGKFRFTGSPRFGEIGSQRGRDATEHSDGSPNLSIQVSASRDPETINREGSTFFEAAATPVVTAPTMT